MRNTNTNQNVFGRRSDSQPTLRNNTLRSQTAADIKEAFAFKHAVNCDYASFENSWKDSLGNQRTGKEPDRRRHLRYVMQSTRDPLDHKHALEQLNEFDRGWKR